MTRPARDTKGPYREKDFLQRYLNTYVNRFTLRSTWFVERVYFNTGQRQLTIHVDFKRGSRFAYRKAPGAKYNVHDTQIKRCGT